MRFNFPMMVCADGYEIVDIDEWNKLNHPPFPHTPPSAAKTELSEEHWQELRDAGVDPDRLTQTAIVRRSNRFAEPAFNAFETPRLYMIMAETEPTPEGALDFISRFGFPVNTVTYHYGTNRFADRGIMEAFYFYGEKQILSAVLDIAGVIDETRKVDWGRLKHWMIGPEARFTTELYPDIEQSPSGQPSLTFRPPGLLSAIYLQLFQDLARGAKFKKCSNPGCRNWFEYGPGSVPLRLERSKYCTPKCQNAHAYQRKKEGGK